MNTTILMIIASIWAGAATFGLVLALRSRNAAHRTLATVRKDRDKAIAVANDWKREVDALKPKPEPKPAAAVTSLNRFLSPRPKPSKARPSTMPSQGPSSRSGLGMPRTSDSTDAMNGMMLGLALASTMDSTPEPARDSSPSYDPTPSYDPGPSSPPSDSGSSFSPDSGGGGDF